MHLYFKALANENTLLPTHCCRHKCFPVCQHAQHLLRTQILCPGYKKVFLILFRNILCPQQMFPGLRSPRNMHDGQQCVLVYQGLYTILSRSFEPKNVTKAGWLCNVLLRQCNYLLTSKAKHPQSPKQTASPKWKAGITNLHAQQFPWHSGTHLCLSDDIFTKRNMRNWMLSFFVFRF